LDGALRTRVGFQSYTETLFHLYTHTPTSRMFTYIAPSDLSDLPLQAPTSPNECAIVCPLCLSSPRNSLRPHSCVRQDPHDGDGQQHDESFECRSRVVSFFLREQCVLKSLEFSSLSCAGENWATVFRPLCSFNVSLQTMLRTAIQYTQPDRTYLILLNYGKSGSGRESRAEGLRPKVTVETCLLPSSGGF
jgi:hypothetical protein